MPLSARCSWVPLVLGAGLLVSSGARGAGDAPPSRIERLGRILTLEDSRTTGAGELDRLLRGPDKGQRRRAALAAGRIASPEAIPALLEMMNDGEPELRQMAAFSLGLIREGVPVDRLVAALSDTDPRVRSRAAEALGRIGNKRSAGPLVEYIRRVSPPASGPLVVRGDDPTNSEDPWNELRQGLLALSSLAEPAAAEAALLNGAQPRFDWWVSVWVAARMEAPPLAPVLVHGARSSDPLCRIHAARGLGALRNPTQVPLLATLVADPDPRVTVAALRALALTGDLRAAREVAAALDSKRPLVLREALEALSRLPRDPSSRQRVVALAGHPLPFVRAAAFPALAHVSREDFALILSGLDPDPDFSVRARVAEALGEAGDEIAVGVLFTMLQEADSRVLPAVLDALRKARGQDSLETLRTHLTHADPVVRAAAARGIAALGQRQLIPEILASFKRFREERELDARLAIVSSFTTIGGAEAWTALREIESSDPARVVRHRAGAALAAAGQAPSDPGPETVSRLPLDYRVALEPFDPIPGERLFSPRALLYTTRGIVELVLDIVETPLTTTTFVDLARRGFYDGLTFHKVEPGFLVLGGDPRGDGTGGPGFTQRCELGQRAFGRGSVGMALHGRDTGGSQFFITTTPQPNLDGQYTLFGQVTAGMDVVEQILPGDRIQRVEVSTGRD